jgi:hypothetical protein
MRLLDGATAASAQSKRLRHGRRTYGARLRARVAVAPAKNSNATGAGMADAFFLQCLREAAANKELVAQFDRLTGSNLSMRGAPIELEIDRTTGRQREELRRFAEFVRDAVYLPLVGGSRD